MDRHKSKVGRSDFVYQELKNKILSNTMKTGQPLTEELLAKTFAVSRTPIREALRMLVSDQLVVSTHNKGYAVRGISEKDMNDIFDIRAALEGWAAGVAAIKISDANLKIIEKCLIDAKEMFDNGSMEKASQIGNEIHNVIAHVVDNYWLSSTLKNLSIFTETYKKLAAKQDGQLQDAHLQHEKIYSALKEHNAELASSAMIEHINCTKRSIQKSLRDTPYREVVTSA